METEWLRTFIVAAKTENFRETAEKCFVMQSIVTKHIQHLRIGMLHTIFFLLGFSIIFIFLGYSSYQDLLRQVGAILIVIFGLMIIAVISPKFLMNARKNTV